MRRGVEVHGCAPDEWGGEAPGNADEEEAERPVEDGRGGGGGVVFEKRRRRRVTHPQLRRRTGGGLRKRARTQRLREFVI